MEDNFFEMILAEKEKKEMAVLMACNEKTETFGLSLTEQEAQELVVCRNESLKKYRRCLLYTSRGRSVSLSI